MKALNLPHKDPILFAKSVIQTQDDTNSVKIEFDTIPSLPMLVEAAAQSSAAFDTGNGKMGYLVTLKNIKLFQKPCSLNYVVNVTSEQQIDALTYFTFETYDEDILIAKGTFIIALQ